MKHIRDTHSNPGLIPCEVNLLQLLEKVTNGGHFNINKTGTRLIYKPGMIDSNQGLLVEHDCHLSRNISYFLEVVCPIAVFGKSEMNLILTGNTDDFIDQSVDSFSRSFGYMMEQFGSTKGTFYMKVLTRGFSPLGGGKVQIKQMWAKVVEPINLTEEGKIKRVRGWVTSAKVSP